MVEDHSCSALRSRWYFTVGVYYESRTKSTVFVKSAPDGVAALTNPRETCWLGGRNIAMEQSQRRTDTSMCVIQHSHKMMKGFLESWRILLCSKPSNYLNAHFLLIIVGHKNSDFQMGSGCSHSTHLEGPGLKEYAVPSALFVTKNPLLWQVTIRSFSNQLSSGGKGWWWLKICWEQNCHWSQLIFL